MSKSHQELILTAIPVGMVASRKWLQENGCAVRTIDNWLVSGRLKALYPGVYIRPETKLTWQGFVISLPRLISARVHVGGISAINELGHSHYLALSKQKTIHLYSQSYCPKWLRLVMEKVPYVSFEWHSTKRLWAETMDDRIFKDWVWREELPSMCLASLEVAILEIMELIPNQVEFNTADELMQSLTTLSPRRCQLALQHCASVKAKRLFFWLSDRQSHSWKRELDSNSVSLGAGKRVIQKNGKLNKRYQITVPREMESANEI